MKQHSTRFLKLREKGMGRGKSHVPGRRTLWDRLNGSDVLLLAICDYLEHDVIPHSEGSAKAELLVAALHDWKENLSNG